MPITCETTGARHQIDTPDKANATYVAGLLFPLRDDNADYPALLMGNYILGSGALSSRLGNRIRQQEGLSYSVSSSLNVSSWDERASLNIMAICNPRNISRVEKAAREELERLLRDGVSAEELANAKQGYLQSQKVARSTDPALVGMLSNLRHLGRTMAFQAEVEDKIQALTPDQVQAAMNRHIDPKKLIVVTAGDFKE
jgi:zinc protease